MFVGVINVTEIIFTMDIANLSAYDPLTRELNLEYFKRLQLENGDENSGRSMKKRNQVIFDRLKTLAEKHDYSPPFHNVICIETDDESKEWLTKISSSKSFIQTEFSESTIKLKDVFSITYFYYSDEKYILISGVDSLDLSPDGFEILDNNAGIFTLFLSLDIISLIDVDTNIGYIYDQFLFHDEKDTDEDIRYIRRDDLERYHSNYHVFKINDDSRFINLNLYQMAAYVSLCLRHKLYEKYTCDITNDLESLILQADTRINFLNFAKAIYIVDEPYILFMELYRMLERLYAIPTIKILQGKLSLAGSCFWSVCKELESATGWRKNEKEGLLSLLDVLNSEQLADMCSILKTSKSSDFSLDNANLKKLNLDNYIATAEQDTNRVSMLEREYKSAMISVLSNYIYQVRNSYVHYRETLNTYLSEHELIVLCKAMLVTINPIYIKVLD